MDWGCRAADRLSAHSYQVTVYKRDFTTPDWFKNSVMYQIFVDRFYNGNEDGSFMAYKDDCIFHDDWSETPCYKPDPKTGEIMCNDFFGGNLPGIIQKLPYLKELGISVLYLNPVFEAYSNHKYDVGNYKNIDPMFGDLGIFRELCSKAKEMGISIILDGVFSHTGSDSVYFNKKAGIPPWEPISPGNLHITPGTGLYVIPTNMTAGGVFIPCRT